MFFKILFSPVLTSVQWQLCKTQNIARILQLDRISPAMACFFSRPIFSDSPTWGEVGADLGVRGVVDLDRDLGTEIEIIVGDGVVMTPGRSEETDPEIVLGHGPEIGMKLKKGP